MDTLYISVCFISAVFWCDCFHFCKHVFCFLPHDPLGLQMSMNPLPYVGFTDGTCHSTRNLYSPAWELFAPNDELVSLRGIYSGHTTNNITEYSMIIKLLSEAIALSI